MEYPSRYGLVKGGAVRMAPFWILKAKPREQSSEHVPGRSVPMGAYLVSLVAEAGPVGTQVQRAYRPLAAKCSFLRCLRPVGLRMRRKDRASLDTRCYTVKENRPSLLRSGDGFFCAVFQSKKAHSSPVLVSAPDGVTVSGVPVRNYAFYRG